MCLPSSSTLKLYDESTRKAAPGTLLDALHRRHSSRTFSPQELSLRHLSRIMWAANGVNRADGHHTSPSAMGLDTLRIYAILQKGVYLYHPESDELEEIAAGDFRGMAGGQDFVCSAPLNIAIYADYSSFVTGNPEVDQSLAGHENQMAGLDAGASAQNIYLYCASEGIHVVERMMMDGKAFAEAFALPSTYHFQVAMTVGYAE